jgi:hypothetical protein
LTVEHRLTRRKSEPANNHLAFPKHTWLEAERALRSWIFHIEEFVGKRTPSTVLMSCGECDTSFM